MKTEWVQRFFPNDLILIYLLSAAIVFLPLLAGSEYLLHLCTICGIYFILLAGFNLCAGTCGLLSFGHGALYALGAYTSVLFVTRMGWPWVPSLIAGIIAALAGGSVLAATGYRVKAFYLALSTLGCGWIVYKVLWNWVDLTGGQPGIPVRPVSIGGVELRESEMRYIIAAFSLFALVVCRNIMSSRTGRALKGISANEEIASANGVNPAKYKFTIFLTSAFFAGLAGIFYAFFSLFIDPSLSSLDMSFSYVVILLIGGSAALFGPILGTIIYIFVPAYLGFLQEYWALLWGVILVIIVLYSPQGIWGILSAFAAGRPFPRLHTGDAQKKEIYEGIWNGPIHLTNSDSALLEVKELCKNFGGLQAIRDVNLTIKPGCIHAIIGPNGAGKTTLINLITGFYSCDGGSIVFKSKRIDRMPPHLIVALGIARTFQGGLLCEGMTTLDNVRLARHTRTRSGIFRSAFATGFARREEMQSERLAYGLLEYIGLTDVAFAAAENIDDGQRRRLEIARALASEPEILILDEPMAGLREEEIRAVMEKLRELRNQGLAIVLIEHHIKAVMAVSDIITVLNFGVKIAQGRPEEIRQNEAVITAYLGRKEKYLEC